ncbi:MAG: RDD family protein [Actinobacteria bacterium]|nr:RDD family protein [Actinomycetota bacterium]
MTPEAVAVRLDVAGLGSRGIALLVDSAIQFGALFVAGLAMSGTSGTGPLVTYLVLLFLVLFAYHPFCEGITHGRTPGKAAQRLRVVQADGTPVTWGPVLVRNLLRLVDWLPGFYGVGAVAVLATSRSQRLGDLAAGTLVIREHHLPAPAPLVLAEDRTGASRAIDVAGLTERDYALVRSFLQRRWEMEPSVRHGLAAQVAGALRARIRAPAGHALGDEAFIEAVAHAYRSRGTREPEPIPPPP